MQTEQNELVSQVLAILEQYQSIQSIFLVGSFARGDYTAFSDIDLCIIFTNDERKGRAEIYQSVKAIRPTLSDLYLYDSEGLFLFDNGVRLDLSFVKPSEFGCWPLGDIKIIKDENGLVEQKLHAQDQGLGSAKPKWNDSEGDLLEWFLWMFRQMYCYAIQAELKPHKRFDKLYAAHTSMVQVADKLIEMDKYVNSYSGYVEENNPRLAKQLTEPLSMPLTIEAIQKSTRLLTDVYGTIGTQYAQTANIRFPAQKLKTLKQLLITFDEELNKSLA
jgi:predicted nucleotidyltransferase